MTGHYEITKQYNNNEEVIVCTNCIDEIVRGEKIEAYHKIDGEWILYTPRLDYTNFFRGICPEHFCDAILGIPGYDNESLPKGP